MLLCGHQQNCTTFSNTTKQFHHFRRGKDVLASAQTGQEKQQVLHPILQTLSNNLSHRPIRALILTPTRELAANIANIKEYGDVLDLRSADFLGKPEATSSSMRQGFDILVATLVD
jgi:ATP-dependent RNA helicase RhlE